MFPSSFCNLVVLSDKLNPQQCEKKPWETYSVLVDRLLHLGDSKKMILVLMIKDIVIHSMVNIHILLDGL